MSLTTIKMATYKEKTNWKNRKIQQETKLVVWSKLTIIKSNVEIVGQHYSFLPESCLCYGHLKSIPKHQIKLYYERCF